VVEFARLRKKFCANEATLENQLHVFDMFAAIWVP